MKHPAPIFQSPDGVYQIDSQGPQRQAIEREKAQFRAVGHGHYMGASLPSRVLPGLSSLGYMNMIGEQDWGTEMHRNEGVELSFLESGDSPFIVDGQRHKLRAGNLCITRPWQLHQLGDPWVGAGRIHWVILDVGVRRPNQSWTWPSWLCLTREDLSELSAALRHNERPVWKVSPDIVQAFMHLVAAVEANEGTSHVSDIAVHINLLLLGVLRMMREGALKTDESLSSHERTIGLFLQDLRVNPRAAAQEWSLASMAEECGVGTTAIHKYCRQLSNESPMKYLAQCRVAHAARILVESPSMPIIDVAFELGFSSSQYFAYLFQRHYKCSPRAYRQRALQEKK